MPEMVAVIVLNFLIALLIGALVGIEREKRKAAEHPGSFGGLRTFILFARRRVRCLAVAASRQALGVHRPRCWQ